MVILFSGKGVYWEAIFSSGNRGDRSKVNGLWLKVGENVRNEDCTLVILVIASEGRGIPVAASEIALLDFIFDTEHI